MTTPGIQVGELAIDTPGAFKIGPFGSSLKKTELVKGGIPVAGIENVLPNNFVKSFRRFITLEKFEALSDYEILPGDLLVTTMGTIGRAAVAPTNLGRTIFDSHLFRMRVDTDRVFPAYLCYALNSDFVSRQLARMARGAIMEGLNTTILRQCQVPLPSLSNQKRITDMLNQADRLRHVRLYALELNDSFLPAVFLEIFGDPSLNPKKYNIVPAGEVFEIQLGKMLDGKRYTGKHLRPYLGNSNVQWGRFDLSEVNVMDFPGKDFERFSLLPGDILVCEGGEVARTAIWKGEIDGCCYQKALHRLRPKTRRILSEYFLYYMRAAVQSGLVARATSTATISHFTAERFEEFPIILPPLSLQEKFADLAKWSERLHSVQTESLRQAEHLFQSLLHRAFSTETLQ